MMEKVSSWKEKLDGKLTTELAREIDIFEQQMELRKQGKIDEKVFAETRLRRGIYGQRYDNGQRHDGKRLQKLGLPGDTLKGPETLWDAPGMMRVKIPFGGITPEQLEVLADLSEEYSDGVRRRSCAVLPRWGLRRGKRAATPCATLRPAR
jgi:sulfite reductase (ferredoxin)